MKQAARIAVVALLGMVAGLGLGQITQADAGGSDPSIAILQRIEKKLGASYQPSTVLGELSDIKSNTWGTCESLHAAGCRLIP